MGTRFNHLQVPDQYNQYFTKYPQGYTILEALLNWVQQVDDLVDNVNNWNDYLDEFVQTWDADLQETVSKLLQEWQESGLLGQIITEALQTGLSDAQNDLRGRAINIKYPPAPLVACKADKVTDDTAALRAIIKYAEDNKMSVILTGICKVTGEIEITKPIVIQGIGAGMGYGDKTVPSYNQISGLYGVGTFTRRVRTRVKFRGSAADAQDAPLSTILNIQSENVVLKDFSVLSENDYVLNDLNSPTYYGSSIDIGIFIGCRVHTHLENIHVVGYFREANIYQDVTRSSLLPEFTALNGSPYPVGTVNNGSDGLTLQSVYTLGGKWGLKIQGAKPKAGQTGYSDPYYDEQLGATVADYRGNFGSSDVTAVGCSFYGTNHHTKYRRDDATGNYLTDTAGGAVSLDGLAGNASGAIQGMRFVSCRFSTWEPYRLKLDRVNRVILIGCHSEWGSGALKKNGSPVLYDDTDSYGPISTTTNTQNTLIIGFNSRIRDAFITGNPLTLIGSANDSDNQFEQGITSKKAVTTVGNVNVGGSVIATAGDMDIRSTDTGKIRGRVGASTRLLIDLINTTLYGHVLPDTDNVNSLGNTTKRFTQGHFTNGIVVTTLDGTKKYLLRVDNNGNVITQLQP
jgi:hypothetical protein